MKNFGRVDLSTRNNQSDFESSPVLDVCGSRCGIVLKLYAAALATAAFA